VVGQKFSGERSAKGGVRLPKPTTHPSPCTTHLKTFSHYSSPHMIPRSSSQPSHSVVHNAYTDTDSDPLRRAIELGIVLHLIHRITFLGPQPEMLGTTVLVRMRMNYLRNNYQIIRFRLGWKFGQGGIGSRTRVFDLSMS
jgi:hypothetical protein